MDFYYLVPLIAAFGCVAVAASILSRDSQDASNRGFAALMGAVAWWGFCESQWNRAPDVETAAQWLRLATLGWVWMAPLVLQLSRAIAPVPGPNVDRLLWLAVPVTIALAWTTPWVHSGVQREPWGYSYSVGPAFVAFHALSAALIGARLYQIVRTVRFAPSPAERRQEWLIKIAVGVPALIAYLTDAVLPALGIQVPRLATFSMLIVGVLVLWATKHFGFSVLVPGSLASEVLEAMPEGVALVGLDGRVRSANSALAVLTESDREIVGVDIRSWIPDFPLRTEPVSDLECTVLPSETRRVPVAISSAPLSDRAGLPIGLILVVRDMREMTELRRQVVSSARMAAVGQLAAGIAHEIANPLTFIRANLGVLREHWDGLDAQVAPEAVRTEGVELISESLEGVDRAAAIVQQVRRFSHRGEANRELVDLREIVQRALLMARPQLTAGVQVVDRLDPVPKARVEAREIEQVLVNCILNASYALDGKGTIVLSTYESGRFVVAEVLDDGCGMDPEVLERVFDPFFTTKPVGVGTGLGLAISYEIVRRHDGEMAIESDTGRGTRVLIRLPADDLGVG